MPKSRTSNPLYVHKRRNGLTIDDLRNTLGYRSTDAVFRLLRYENGPSVPVAQRIAQLIGWDLGEVLMDYYRNVRRAR